MGQQISLTHNGKTYTLEFTRKTITEMERRGFVASELVEKPMTNIPALFAGAFLANHRYMKREVIDEIFFTMKRRGDLLETLVEMYNEPLQMLSNIDEDGADEGNEGWVKLK